MRLDEPRKSEKPANEGPVGLETGLVVGDVEVQLGPEGHPVVGGEALEVPAGAGGRVPGGAPGQVDPQPVEVGEDPALGDSLPGVQALPGPGDLEISLGDSDSITALGTCT